MLKIKDNVELKRLEEFGFSAFAPITQPEYVEYISSDGRISIYGDIVLAETDFVFPRRMIVSGYSIKTMDILYDLIKNDIVERI